METKTFKHKFCSGETVYSFTFNGKFNIEKFKIHIVRATIINNNLFVSYLDEYWREFSDKTCFKTLKGVKNYIRSIYGNKRTEDWKVEEGNRKNRT